MRFSASFTLILMGLFLFGCGKGKEPEKGADEDPGKSVKKTTLVSKLPTEFTTKTGEEYARQRIKEGYLVLYRVNRDRTFPGSPKFVEILDEKNISYVNDVKIRKQTDFARAFNRVMLEEIAKQHGPDFIRRAISSSR